MENKVQILTGKLKLRPIRLKDSGSIFSYRSNSSVNQYQGWIPKIIEDVRDFIINRTSPEINLPGTWFQFVIINLENNELIGDIGVHFSDSDERQAELGITLNQNHHGKGFATEAMTGIINFLFDHLDKNRITASIDPRNLKSIQLFERIGFQKEAHFEKCIFINGEWVDDLIYALQKVNLETGSQYGQVLKIERDL